MVNSDLSPIIVEPNLTSTSGRRFKFEAFWQEHTDFDQVLQNNWASGIGEYNSWQKLTKCMTNCKSKLTQWHKRTFINAKNEIDNLSKDLQGLLNSP